MFKCIFLKYFTGICSQGSNGGVFTDCSQKWNEINHSSPNTPIRDNAVAHINLPIMYSWCSVPNILISFKRFASIVTLYRFLFGYHSKNYIINSLSYMCLNLMGRRVALLGLKSYIFDFDNFMACFLSSPPRLVVIFWNEVFPKSQWVSVDSTVLTWPYPKHRSTNIIPIGYADYQRRHNISSRAIFTNMV